MILQRLVFQNVICTSPRALGVVIVGFCVGDCGAMPAVSVVSVGVDWDGGAVRSASGGVDSADPIFVANERHALGMCPRHGQKRQRRHGVHSHGKFLWHQSN